jgi:hypothetical protein
MATDGLRERRFAALDEIRVPGLTTAEQFIVGTCRCWDAFQAGPDPTRAYRELAPVFAYMNVMGAMCAFDSTFSVLHRRGGSSLAFYEVDSPRLGLDEACVLSGLASLQRGRTRDAVAVLRRSLNRCGVHAVLAPLARIAAILEVRGHRLPAWRDTPKEGCADAFSPARDALPQDGTSWLRRCLLQ